MWTRERKTEKRPKYKVVLNWDHVYVDFTQYRLHVVPWVVVGLSFRVGVHNFDGVLLWFVVSTHPIYECFLPVIDLAAWGPGSDTGAMLGYAQTKLYEIFSHTELLTWAAASNLFHTTDRFHVGQYFHRLDGCHVFYSVILFWLLSIVENPNLQR